MKIPTERVYVFHKKISSYAEEIELAGAFCVFVSLTEKINTNNILQGSWEHKIRALQEYFLSWYYSHVILFFYIVSLGSFYE